MSAFFTSDPLGTPQARNLCVQNSCHTGSLSRPSLFGCVETAGSPLLSGSHEDSSVIHNPVHLEQGVLLIVPVNLDVMFCNRGRERPQSKEAKDVEQCIFRGKWGLLTTLWESGYAVSEGTLGLCVHTCMSVRSGVCDSVSKLLDDKPESTRGFELKWLELGHTGSMSKVSPEILERS